MNKLLNILYNMIVIPFLYLASVVALPFNKKIRIGKRGRRKLFSKLKKDLEVFPKDEKRFWIHNCSMGEFEQSKPIIENLKNAFPTAVVIVSFFSPSAFDHVQHYKGADYLCYLPFDSKPNARRFINLLRPDLAVVIRHDFWPNHLAEINRRGIPCILVNSSVRHISHFRYPLILSVNQWIFSHFDWILAVSEETRNRFQQYKLSHARLEVTGDTRYDQVVRRAEEAEQIVAPLRDLKGGRMAFVMGSTWPSDEEVLFDALKELRQEGVVFWLVVVPHEPHEEHLVQIEKRLMGEGLQVMRLSEFPGKGLKENDVLLVDKVGILASLYALGDLTFVGGGFGPGVHNVLEPAALQKVVFYGPRCRNSFEAGELERHGVGFIVEDQEMLKMRISEMFNNRKEMSDLGKKAAGLVEKNVGATERVVSRLINLVQ